MKCPICSDRTYCKDSRSADGVTRRRYLCDSNHRFSTVEVYVANTSQGRPFVGITADTLRRLEEIEHKARLVDELVSQLNRRDTE